MKEISQNRKRKIAELIGFRGLFISVGLALASFALRFLPLKKDSDQAALFLSFLPILIVSLWFTMSGFWGLITGFIVSPGSWGWLFSH